ncbi:MAG: 50S ribosomal protein L9 [Patescibacteria group bacterium]
MAKTKRKKSGKKPIKNKGMNVVLLDDISKLGQRGELKTVKPGYYTFLSKAKKVTAITKKNMHQLEDLKLMSLKRANKGKALSEALKLKVDGLVFRAGIKVGEHGEIYSSITKNDVKSFLAKEGIKIEKDHIELEHPIREICETSIKIHLGYENIGILRIIVEPEKSKTNT